LEVRWGKMEYRKLGKTGITVSRLAYGTLALGPYQANLSLKAGAKLLREALDLGVNFIDTAEVYDTYAYIREAIHGQRGKVVLCSRSYAYDELGMRHSLQKALDAFNTDYIDIFMLHEQESALTLKGHRPALEYLLKAKEQGLIKAIGLSTHYLAGVKAALDTPEIEVIFALLNHKGIGIQDGSAAQMQSLLDQAEKLGKGIFIMKALGGGHLYKHSFEALTWVRDLPWVHSVAVGMQSQEELLYNCAVFSESVPEKQIAEKLNLAKRELKIEFCCGCGKCIPHCPFEALSLKGGKVEVDKDKCLLCSYCASHCEGFCLKVG
jgi:predicted aldo/keto reductase-like oxidoreductase